MHQALYQKLLRIVSTIKKQEKWNDLGHEKYVKCVTNTIILDFPVHTLCHA